MSDPIRYLKRYSFSGFQATAPDDPLPGARVDDELANIATSIDETVEALKDLRRSDGRLMNASVGPDQLSSALIMGFTLRGIWADGEEYLAADGVVHDSVFYAASVAHTATAGTRPDLDATTWRVLFTLPELLIAVGSLNGNVLIDATVTYAKLAAAALASQLEAEAGLSNVKLMTALRVLQAIQANPQAPPAGSVTNAKLANVATATFKGRVSAGSGSPEDLTVAQVKALLALGAADISGLGAGATAAVASQAEAEAGVDNTKYTTPLRVRQAIAAQVSVGLTKAFESAQQTITLSGTYTIAHGLGARPTLTFTELECVTADSGYSIGDRLMIGGFADTNTTAISGPAVVADATNLVCRWGSAMPYVPNKGTGASALLTAASWRWRVRAWL